MVTENNHAGGTNNVKNDDEKHQKYPRGFQMIQDFISAKDETSKLLDEINQNSWSWEGFVTRRRMQKYNFRVDDNGDATLSSSPSSSSTQQDLFPPTLQTIVKRFLSENQNFHHPRQIIIEELTHQNLPTATPEEQLTIFESILTNYQCDSNGDDNNYVAQLCIAGNAIQALHLPEQRDPECWNVKEHMDIEMKPNSLCIKTQDSLWNWRYNISRSYRNTISSNSDNHTDEGQQQKVILVKLNGIKLVTPEMKSDGNDDGSCQEEAMSNLSLNDNASEHKSQGSLLEENGNTSEMPRMSEILTIIISTSPIKSHPSTELLEKTMETFGLAGSEFAQKCRKVIVCDGCRVFEETDQEGNDDDQARGKNGELLKPKKISRKHANTKQALRNGIATADQAENYRLFKQALQQKCQAGEAPFFNTTVVELPSRHGFGFALRHALRHNVSTPYVCVIQHDRTFMRPTPMEQVMKTIYSNRSKIKYVGINMRSNLMYGDIFLSKYGKTAYDEFCQLIVRPPELLLSSDVWGPNGHSVKSMECTTPKVRKNIDSLSQTYSGCVQATEQQKWIQENPTPEGFHQLTLTPTLFWYDNTHICDTAFYRDFVFDPKNKMVVKGGFVEETLSPVIVKSAERLGLEKGHGKFGSYILDDHSGMFFTGHLDGGAYLTAEDKRKLVNKKKT